MKKSKAAIIYARTLLETASSQNTQEAVSADISAISDSFSKLPNLHGFLTNPIRGVDEKAKLFSGALGKVSPLTAKFLKLLEVKNRFGLLRDIAEEYLALEESKQNIERATVYSASALGADQLAKLTKALETKKPGKKFVLTNQVDPSLIAGFKIKQGDTITDASIKNKLDLIRQKLAA